MTISLESVLVTGAASGIGRGVAKALAEQSVMALCLDADREKLDETVAQIRNAGGLAEAYVADITDEQSLAAMFAKIATLDRKLEGVVTCAGIQNKTSILDLTVAEWDHVMAVNMRGTFLCVQGALRIMMPREKGRIVTISSDTGKRGGGRGGKSAYGASKGAVLVFTRSLARELVSFGGKIRVNCLCPGPILTPMNAAVHGVYEDVSLDAPPKAHASVPIGRFGVPREVAEGVLFLLSDEASFVYGESLCVDGGMVMD